MSFTARRATALVQPFKTQALRQRFASTSAEASSSTSSASASSPSEATHYLITLKRSPIGLPDTTKRTLASLGFLPSTQYIHPKGPKASANPKLHRSVLHPFSETCAGMILAVKELVEVRNVSRAVGEEEIVRRNGRKGEGRGWEVAGSARV
jgi:large subunit ribosomal protein L30